LLTQPIVPADNGSFNFTNLDNGSYLLYITIDGASAYSNNYISTYFGDVDNWSAAVPIVINNGNPSNQTINLIAYTSPDLTWNTGNDTLAGIITFDASQPLRVATFSPNPASNALVKLYNSNDVLLTSTHTDDFGYYAFPDLIGGTYKIQVEYAGTTTATPFVSAVVDGNPATPTQANTEVLKQNIASGISQNHYISAVGAKMYPNPAYAEFNIELPSEATGASTISIYNVMGQLQYKEEHNIISGDNINLNVQSLASGLHIVEIVNGNKIYKGKLSKN
jgi:hypothetical protein